MDMGPTTGTSTLRRFIVTVMTRYTVDFTNSPSGEVLMTRVRSTEEPCASKGARTVLETSGGSDPLTEFNRALRPGVLWRKGSFGTQSEEGSRFVESLMTVVATLRQQQRNILAYLIAACEAALRGEAAPSLLPASDEKLQAAA
jgi:transposase